MVGTSTQVRGHSAYIRSLVLKPKSLTSPVAKIRKYYLGRAPSTGSYVVWTHTGAKIRENATVPSSYAHRDCEYTFELKSEWNARNPLLARPNIEWAVGFFDELGKHAAGAYINYIDPLLLDWSERYYRHEYPRLIKVLERWDREGRFTTQQGVGSDYVTASRRKPVEPPAKPRPVDLNPLTRTFYNLKKTRAIHAERGRR